MASPICQVKFIGWTLSVSPIFVPFLRGSVICVQSEVLQVRLLKSSHGAKWAFQRILFVPNNVHLSSTMQHISREDEAMSAYAKYAWLKTRTTNFNNLHSVKCVSNIMYCSCLPIKQIKPNEVYFYIHYMRKKVGIVSWPFYLENVRLDWILKLRWKNWLLQKKFRTIVNDMSEKLWKIKLKFTE